MGECYQRRNYGEGTRGRPPSSPSLKKFKFPGRKMEILQKRSPPSIKTEFFSQKLDLTLKNQHFARLDTSQN
jgi:hypothetical protein